VRASLLLLALAAGCAGPDGPFVDVATRRGVTHRQGSDEAPCFFAGTCEPERFSGGAAAGDLDGDGDLDLVFPRLGDTPAVYANDGTGRFDAFPAGLPPLRGNGAGLADLDDDGDLDLVVSTVGERPPDDRPHLFLNAGDGTFHEAPGAFVSADGPQAGQSVSFGDPDGDGDLDVFIGEWLGTVDGTGQSASRLYRNEGGGRFVDATHVFGLAPADCAEGGGLCGRSVFGGVFTDLDDDGAVDLYVVADFGGSRMFWNEGGRFVEDPGDVLGDEENGMGAAVGDVDGDGDLDLFVTSIFAARACVLGCTWGRSGNRLYLNQGGRRFVDGTDRAGVRDGGWGWGAAFVDADLDGDLDLVQANGVSLDGLGVDDGFNRQRLRFWLNDGSGRFVDAAGALGLEDRSEGRGVLAADLDGDGDEDLVVVTPGGAPRMLENRLAAGDVLRVPAPHGSRVTLVVEDDRAVREVGSSSVFLTSGEAAVRFPLPEGPHTVEVAGRPR
jgi:hypothetical protein